MKLNQKTRWGIFLDYNLVIDQSWPDHDYYEFWLSKGVRYARFPQEANLTMKFLKDRITYEVIYTAMNVSGEDILLIQNKLMQCLRATPRTSKFNGYPEGFTIGKSKFKLASISALSI